MTKIVEKDVKCIKCNKESKQIIVYSVNFMLGDEESNKKLLKHQQECPHCGYKATDISKE